jgi:hypothetical protein
MLGDRQEAMDWLQVRLGAVCSVVVVLLPSESSMIPVLMLDDENDLQDALARGAAVSN